MQRFSAPSRTCRFFLWFFLLAVPLSSQAQDEENAQGGNAVYRSEVDELMTVRRLAVLPFSDNVEGIYSRPLEAHVLQRLRENHRWDLIEANSVGPILSPEELEEKPDSVKALSAGLEADALIVSRITKGPNGISVKMNMFLTKDGKLFAQAAHKDLTRFEIAEMKSHMEELLGKLLSRVPYEGLILSRQGQRVTVNLGKKDGMEPGRIVNAVQIIKVTRHPKFHFLINVEKEILGKVKLVKVDESLSFGQIVSEKGKGTIRKDSKVSGVEFVTYGETSDWTDNKDKDSLLQRPDSLVTFGKDAQEWVPRKPPTFGQVGARFGLGAFNGNMNLNTPTENLNANALFYPSVALEGELWLTPNWTVRAGIRQGIISIDNPKRDTQTKELSQALSSYDFTIGYTMRFTPGVWGPKVEVLGGYGMYRLYVDNTVDSNGFRGLTTLQYNGFKFGVLGSYPLTPDQSWAAGAKFFFFLNPRLNESPISSGRATNTVNQFGFFADRRLSPNLKGQIGLDFELYSTEFSGGRASSSSQKHSTLSAGVYYMF